MPTPSNGMKALEIIRLTMPEFKGIEDETIEKWVSLIRPLVSDVKFKSQYEHAVALLAGHKMKLSGLGDGLAGTDLTLTSTAGLASVSEGETSISLDSSASSLAASNPVDAEYIKTVYGLQFLSLRRMMVMPIVIDGSGIR